MFPQIGKSFRTSRIFSQDGKTLIVGLDSEFALGQVENLLETRNALARILKSKPDAIILDKGQVARLESLIGGRGPAVLIRADFTNALRSTDSTLPLKELEHVKLADPKEAIMLGVEGVAACLFVGGENEEARSIKIVSSLVSECRRFGLPLLVESIPIGERVTETNRLDCLKLAVRMAVEAGADVVAVPYAGDEMSVHSVVEVAGQTPILTIDDPMRSLMELRNAVSAGCAGLVLRERLASGNIEEIVAETRLLVHGC